MTNVEKQAKIEMLKKELLRIYKSLEAHPVYGHCPEETASYLESIQRNNPTNIPIREKLLEERDQVFKDLEELGFDVKGYKEAFDKAFEIYNYKLKDGEQLLKVITGKRCPEKVELAIAKGIDIDALLANYESTLNKRKR